MNEPEPSPWALATDPTDDEVARLLSRRPSKSPVPARDPRAGVWAAATLPTAAEVSRATLVFDESWAQAVTEPAEPEVQRLLARLARQRVVSAPAGSPGWSWVVGPRTVAGVAMLAGGVALTLLASNAVVSSAVDTWEPGEVAVLTAATPVGPSIVVAPHTEQPPKLAYRLPQADGATRLDLESGIARFVVDPNGTRRDLRVIAGDVEVRVKGTIFTVLRDGPTVEVQVERGRVEVVGSHGATTLVAGGFWTNAIVASVSPEAFPAPEPASAADPETVAELPSYMPAPSLGIQAPAAPVVPVTPLARPNESAGPTSQKPPEPRATAWTEETGLRQEVPLPPREFADLERLRNVQVQLRAGGDARAALRELDDFLASSPDPHLAVIALELALDAAVATSDPVALDQAVEALLSARPDHPRRTQATWAQGRSRLSRGGCSSALPYFAEAAAGTSVDAARAAIDQAACLVASGKRSEAKMVLRRVLSMNIPNDLRILVEERLDEAGR
jgi:hypothetical protein